MKKITVPINKVVLLLTLSDTLSWGPLIIVSSLSGIYLANKLGEDALRFVGIGTGIYFVTRAVFQIPIGKFVDKLKRDIEEIYILMVGVILMGISYLFYPMITSEIHYYICQFVFGLGVALNVVNWRKLFALNVSVGQEGKEYAMYDTFLSISTAIFSIVGGVVANISGKYFDIVMMSAGICMILASMFVFSISKVKNRRSRV